MNRIFVAEGPRTAARAAILASLLLFAGCNSGRGGGPSSQPPPPAFSVGGSVSGLSGQVTVRLNAGPDFVLGTNGAFTFPGATPVGTAYTVTVQVQPSAPAQTCVLANATGTVAAAVTNITVTCTTNTYRVRGTLGGLAGASVVLRNNGGDDLALSANGAFLFASAVPSGDAYAVTVQTQPLGPSQTCVVTQGTGNVAAADVTVTVNCTTNSFMVGGNVTGMVGAGLVLRNNAGNDLTVNANGAFAFGTPVVSGGSYLVTVLSTPPSQQCLVANGGGTVLAANVINVTITCGTTYTIGGTVRGLDVGGLVLRNSGGDDLTVNANGSFAFATPVVLGGSYNVTAVAGTPASPRHVCQIVNGTGTVNTNANVNSVDVTCEADRFAYVAQYNLNGPYSGSAITTYAANHETGALTLIAGSSVPLIDSGATSIVSDPRGRFIYVASYWADTVSGFSVDPVSGALTPVPGSPYPVGDMPRDVAIDSEGKFLYSTAWYSGEIYGWAIQADGSLVAVPGSPVSMMSGGGSTGPVSIAMSPARHCCYMYVANQLAFPALLSAFSYDRNTGALAPLAGSPYPLPGLYTSASVVANNTGEFVYVSATGTSNIATFDIASGSGVLTERPGSPTPFTSGPCEIFQPPLSPSIFVASSNAYLMSLWGADANTALPVYRTYADLEAGNFCTVATDPYGRFAYTTNNNADTLFGFSVDEIAGTFTPLALGPTPPVNRLTTPAREPKAMVLRYSRRDREVLQVPD